jgi:hypothetical protein
MIWFSHRDHYSDDGLAGGVTGRPRSITENSTVSPVSPEATQPSAAHAMVGRHEAHAIEAGQPQPVPRQGISTEVAIMMPVNQLLMKYGDEQADGQGLPACHDRPEWDFGHPLDMGAESSGADTRSTAEGGGSSKGAESGGISQLLGKILEQLNISAWLPAAMLIGNLALLFQLHSNGNFDIANAVKDLAGKPLGTLIVLGFSLLLATIVTQAFEFEIIRLLEGYVDATNKIFRPVISIRIRHHEEKRNKLNQLYIEAQQAAFMQARTNMLSRPGAYDRTALDFLEDDIFQRPKREITPAVSRVIDEIDWRQHLPSSVSYQMECIDSRLNSYPESNRILPTRLGNVLRAAEDELELGEDDELENFVIRYYEELPTALKEEHKDYRTRLDMYCSLVLIFALLTPLGIALLIGVTPGWGAILFAMGYALMSFVCYEAAIASARGYGDVLKEINRRIGTVANDGGA